MIKPCSRLLGLAVSSTVFHASFLFRCLLITLSHPRHAFRLSSASLPPSVRIHEVCILSSSSFHPSVTCRRNRRRVLLEVLSVLFTQSPSPLLAVLSRGTVFVEIACPASLLLVYSIRNQLVTFGPILTPLPPLSLIFR